MVCTGWGLVLAGRSLAVRMSLEILVTTWQPDRSHLFGPRQMLELTRSVDVPMSVPPQDFLPRRIASGT